MTIKRAKIRLTDFYERKDMEAFVHFLEGIVPPRKFNKISVEWMNESFGEDQDAWDAFFNSFTKEQWERFKYLASSERERKYLLDLADKRELTPQEWFDLRACDF